MKRNIDLTEDMIFSRKSILSNVIDLNNLNWGFIARDRIPWRIDFELVNSEDELDMDHQRKSLIALGNKAMRKKIKLFREMDSMNYCDRCGDKLNSIPWDRQVGLCKKCNDDFSREFDDKCKWRIKEEIQNAVIRIA